MAIAHSHVDIIDTATELVAMLEGLELAVGNERIDYETHRALSHWTALAADKAAVLKHALEAALPASKAA
jgi:hypothetical protein